MRTADNPWGPWSEPVTWIDCRPLAEDVYPYCYSAEIHRELSRDGGDTIYVTFSSQKPYDVTLVELHLGVAIHEWRAPESGDLRYAVSSPGDGYEDAGIAFYASDRAAAGLAPVYLARDGTYTLADPGNGAPAFYTYAEAADGAVRTQPVHRWQRDGAEALATGERPGWQRGGVAFYVACYDSPSTNSGCGR